MKDTKFEKANKTIHKVEDQWHYPIMTEYGYKPLDKEGVGFVRSYKYKNDDGHQITVTTGLNSDYWFDERSGTTGLWNDLKPHLQKLKGQE